VLDTDPVKILYLYEEVMGYTMATISELADRGADLHVIHWDHKKLTPYQLPQARNVHFYARSRLTHEAMRGIASEIAPAITVVSGWNDKGYLKVAKALKTSGSTVVVALDGQWRGTTRQKVAAALGSGGYFRRYFSHAWVAGAYQFEYARRLGFDKNKIVFDLYSADVDLFHHVHRQASSQRSVRYPHRFQFIGRFEPVKGLDVLIEAWRILGDAKRDWDLCLIGHGSLRNMLTAMPGVVVKDFMQPNDLLEELQHAGCFILPSHTEPWGVAVHECAAAGIPLILSDAVGAVAALLIPGMNGFTFSTGDPRALASRMAQIVALSDEELRAMSDRSYDLSHRITPESSAANLLSLVSS
jgi:glycosyltransferase involved in cell wall biosynthesis